MNYLVNQAGSVEDIRASLKFKEAYTTDDLWLALRNERKNQNRHTVVKMLRTALRRTLRHAIAAIALLCLATSCSVPSKLTQGELEALVAYDRAEYRILTVYNSPQRIYFVDSTTVWTPCGEGWYCRSREIEKYMADPAIKTPSKPAQKPVKR